MIKLFEKYKNVDIKNKTLLVVDIQPAYQKWISFSVFTFLNFLNRNFEEFNRVIFFFNGPEMGYEDEHEFKTWLQFDNNLDEEIVDNADFYDKSYNYFRNCIDAGLYEKKIVKLIKFMLNKDLWDSREFNEDDWDEFIKSHPDSEDVRELMEGNEDCIWIPDLIEYIQDNVHGELLLCGGGTNECLKEVEIALQVLDKDYEILKEFTY